jgi:menaquinone-9 beta-reductase
MERCEVLIVGAGPAGSTCARILAKWGISVLLLDQDQFPRDKPCAGWITPAVLEALRIDPEHYRQGRLLQEIRAFRTGVIYGKETLTDYGSAVSYGIRRTEFDHFLLLNNTSRTSLGETVQSLERTADGWLVNGRIHARLLVGAGGHSCPVARTLGANPGRERAIVAMVAEFEMGEAQLANSRLTAGHTALCFSNDSKGYGWLLRKGTFLNIGLGILGATELRLRLDDFCAHLRHRGDLAGELCGPLREHAYLSYQNRGGRRIVGDRALLIGDAAGLAFPESGEGILPAVESAIMAAQAILCASGDYRPRWLEPYATAVATRFGSRGADSETSCFSAGVKGLGARMLFSSGWLTRHLVLDRWFLHRGQRPLVPKTVQGRKEAAQVPLVR